MSKVAETVVSRFAGPPPLTPGALAFAKRGVTALIEDRRDDPRRDEALHRCLRGGSPPCCRWESPSRILGAGQELGRGVRDAPVQNSVAPPHLLAPSPVAPDAFLAPSQGSFLAHRSTQPHCSGLHGSRLPAFRVASARSHRLPATRQDRLGPRMQEGKSAGQLVVRVLLARTAPLLARL